jgi:hypothetical protein
MSGKRKDLHPYQSCRDGSCELPYCRIWKAAWAEGYAAGSEDGFKSGFEAGLEQGRAEHERN